MYKNVLAVLLVMFLTIFSVASVEACHGNGCSIEVNGIEIIASQDAVTYGQTFEGTQDVVGCNVDGMFEKTKLNVAGSSSGASMSSGLEVVRTGNKCVGCGNDYLVGGIMAQTLNARLSSYGFVNLGGGSNVGYNSTGNYKGGTITVWGASNLFN